MGNSLFPSSTNTESTEASQSRQSPPVKPPIGCQSSQPSCPSSDIRPSPPAYEEIINQSISQPPPYVTDYNPTNVQTGSLPPHLSNSATSPEASSNNQTNRRRKYPKRRSQIQRQIESAILDYSDDPSDYESDHNGRKMRMGYYCENDYYDRDKYYIYYKTLNGRRYKHYR